MKDNKVALKDIPAILETTGFVHEYFVAEEFRKNGWSIIGGRYYADDIDGRARELDLVVYRVQKHGDLDVVTAALVSCKKDAANTWVFMSKDKPVYDPNFDWNPIHYWTDSEPVATFLSSADWESSYIKSLGAPYKKYFEAKRSVFAFQQISNSGKVQNDKLVFDSLASLLKALDHELAVLPDRQKGKNRLYVFNLITVVDAPMVDAKFTAHGVEAENIESIVHLSNYLVRRKDLSALICFIEKSKLPDMVKSLTKISESSAKFFVDKVTEAYDAILTNADVRKYFSKRLLPWLKWQLNEILKKGGSADSITSLALSIDDGELSVDLDISEEGLDILQSSKSAKSIVNMRLRKVARYEGEWKFSIDIPF